MNGDELHLEKSGVTDEQKLELNNVLADLSKASSQGAKLILAGETVLAKVGSIKEGELFEMNINQSRQVCEEAEEVFK